MLKHSKKVWAVTSLRWPVIILSGLCVVSMLSVSPAQSTTDAAVSLTQHDQRMSYEVYAGGINAVEAKLDISYESEQRYHLALEAWTKGFLGKLAPWSGTFETNGWRMKDGARPELHKSVAVWRDEEEIKEYSYGKDGTFKGLRVVEEGKDKTPNQIEDELTQGTTDVLSATLEVMKNVAHNGQCEGSSEVFDGSRRFEMVFKQDAEEILDATRYNVYEGPSVRCTVEVKPIAGKWHSKPRGWMSIQEQGREKGTMPTVWLAKIDDTGPAVPVKVRVKTDYGVLFMHLIRYKNGDKEIVAGVAD